MFSRLSILYSAVCDKHFKEYTFKMSKCFIPSSYSAILVLIWDALMYSQVLFLRYFVATYFSTSLLKNNYSSIVFDVCYCLLYISFPLVGLLADVWIGRYKAITGDIIMCFLAWILAGIGYIVKDVFDSHIIFYTLYGFAYLLELVGYASFKANIVQYNIDQLVGASADELSTVIYLHCFSIPLALTVLKLCRCLIDSFILPSYIISGLSVSIVLVTHSLFKHWLENISLIDNPIKLIFRVLNYARKHKYPENRSALTYWEEEVPSRLDLGKEKYGGPFSEEEVENVKTIFRMIPLFISMIGLGCTDETYWNIMSGQAVKVSYISCFTSLNFFNSLTPTVLLVFYFLLRLCLHKYIPSMLKKIGLGLLFAVCSMASYTVILRFYGTGNEPSYINNVLIIPQILSGIAYFSTFSASFEFTIAQCPVQMRGVMVGMCMASLGIGYAININLQYPFGCNNDVLCTSFKYYATKTGIVLLILIVFVILAKYYKFRVRENEVNIHQIVDDHYQRYMEQEEQYNIS